MRAAIVGIAVVLTASCGRARDVREYELVGQVLSVRAEQREVVIRHEDIKGFMPGMTMPFTVRDASLLSGVGPGDLIRGTLAVSEVDAHLTTLERTGHSPLPGPAPAAEAPAVASPGDPIADARLVDERGRPWTFSSLRGHRVAVTFVYTRCPLPEFCPLMDRHFRAVQADLARRPDLADARLVTVTLDPEFDTPAVLESYARRLGADPAVWTFVTGEPAEVSRFSEQFGLYVERPSGRSADIVHNLRTAVVDAGGRLVKVHSGNSWTPAELVADLLATPAPRR
jgi:protein SCO1/2